MLLLRLGLLHGDYLGPLTLDVVLERDVSRCAREAGLLHTAHEVLVLGHVAQIRHVVVGRKGDGARLGEDLEPLLERLALVRLIVVVGAVGLGALLTVFAGVELVVLGVVLLLLPAVALQALVLVLTAILVLVDELPGAPVRALVSGVDVELGLAAEVLPVVREDALVSLVVVLVVGTPHCLEVEHVEIRVQVEAVNQLHRDLSLRVRERAVLPVLALARPVNIGGAKLCLVLVWVVEFFDAVVRLLAGVAFGAVSPFDDVSAHLRLIGAQGPALVLLLVVVVGAALKVVGVRIDAARLHLEERQIQEPTVGFNVVRRERGRLLGLRPV